MRKKDRHRLITRLLSEQDIRKQEEFVEILKSKGISVTQATISRDIKELKLIKVPASDGGYRYSIPAETNEDVNTKLEKLLKDAFVAVDQMEKFVILKTLPGNASAAANLIDKRYKKELFSIINDDDNVLMITRTEDQAVLLKKYYENVILITRGILKKQHRNRMSLKREKGRNMNYVGIDIGSTASKVVVEGDKKEHFVLPTGWSSKETCEKIKNKLLEMGVDVTSDDTKVVATGYGRIAVDFADHVITEITCHARGGRELAGGDCSIIDVGGQDTKVIIVQNGMVSDFQMNDKCSAGTGKFLEIMANRLGVTINELFDMAAAGEVIPISSLCTVFAESEVINYIGEGKKREDIAAGVVDSVANKVVQLAQKKELGDRVILTGGLSHSIYFTGILSDKLDQKVESEEFGRFAGAYGAALLAREKKDKRR